MSADFVRYSPDIETFDPKLSEYMARIIEFWEKKVANSPVAEGSGRAVRGAHAKTLGVVRAQVEMSGTAPAPYAQGIYARPGRLTCQRRRGEALPEPPAGPQRPRARDLELVHTSCHRLLRPVHR